MGLATGDGGDALPLRSIDVVADRLLLLGGSFDAARLRAQPSTIGTDVHVDSPRLAGSLSIPRAESAPVTDIGRALSRERVCPYVELLVVAVPLKKKKTQR